MAASSHASNVALGDSSTMADSAAVHYNVTNVDSGTMEARAAVDVNVTNVDSVTMAASTAASTVQAVQWHHCYTGEAVPPTAAKTVFLSPVTSSEVCAHEWCNAAAMKGRGVCKAHGGASRRTCRHDGCYKAARGGTWLCVKHGGGKRCTHDGCDKSAQGSTDLCMKHGGGKRCSREGCTKLPQRGNGLCKAHGGGLSMQSREKSLFVPVLAYVSTISVSETQPTPNNNPDPHRPAKR